MMRHGAALPTFGRESGGFEAAPSPGGRCPCRRSRRHAATAGTAGLAAGCRRMNEVRTSDALRHEIDRGRTGDKIAFPDPAAAPLGTDDEAAGGAPSAAAVAHAAAAEQRAGGVAAPAASNETSRAIDGAETERRENRRWLIAGTLIVLGVTALVAVLLLVA